MLTLLRILMSSSITTAYIDCSAFRVICKILIVATLVTNCGRFAITDLFEGQVLLPFLNPLCALVTIVYSLLPGFVVARSDILLLATRTDILHNFRVRGSEWF